MEMQGRVHMPQRLHAFGMLASLISVCSAIGAYVFSQAEREEYFRAQAEIEGIIKITEERAKAADFIEHIKYEVSQLSLKYEAESPHAAATQMLLEMRSLLQQSGFLIEGIGIPNLQKEDDFVFLSFEIRGLADIVSLKDVLLLIEDSDLNFFIERFVVRNPDWSIGRSQLLVDFRVTGFLFTAG